MPSQQLQAAPGPGLFGVPVRAWAKGVVGSEFGGSAPKGVRPDGLVSTLPFGFSTYAAPVAASPSARPAAGYANLFIRKTGTDNNGGSSASVTPDATGTDGVTNGTTTFTAASGTFSASDVNKFINIVTKGRYRVVAVGGTTSITLSGSPTAGTGLTWNLGGAVLTIGSLLTVTNTPAGSVVGGDRIWIGAGTYREVVTVGVTPTFDLQVVGDIDGAMTGDAGAVTWTAFLTNDKTAPSATALLNLGGKSNLTFLNICFQMGTGNIVSADTLTSQFITFRNCFFQGNPSQQSSAMLAATCGYQTPFFWTIDRCTFIGTGTTQLRILLTRGVGGDYDAAFSITNSILNSWTTVAALSVNGTGTGTYFGGGVRVRNSMFLGGDSVVCTAAVLSQGYPCSIFSSVCYNPNRTPLQGGTQGQLVEDYNLLYANSPRSAVTIGPHSVSDGSYAYMFSFGQELVWGGLPRPFLTPLSGAPALGFGGGMLANDLDGNPRPAGGGSSLAAAGALERGSTSAQATSPVPPSGTHIWQFTGPAYQDFLVPVAASATTIAVSVQRDSSYTGTLPTLELIGNGQIGVPALVAAASGPPSAWETLTLVPFTPTGTGVVTVRIRSLDTTGVSVVSFANFTVT